MEPIKTFFMEPTDKVRLWLRRYSHDDALCNGSSYHNGMLPLGEFPAIYVERPGRGGKLLDSRPERFEPTDPRWPAKCEHCAYVFQDCDPRQVFQDSIYRRADTGEEFPLRELPLGAMYFADWMIHEGSGWNRGPDGHCLIVIVPTTGMRPTQWAVDGRCNNCTLPKDDAHKCWVRHGNPATEPVHVDKAGHTCSAGAGSIQTSGWHGFLDHGWLVENRGQAKGR